jgi:hypothetical protein
MKRTLFALAAICVWLIQPAQIENNIFSKEAFAKAHPYFRFYGKRILRPSSHSAYTYIMAENGTQIELPPPLQKIAFCESSGVHYLKNGDVLRGKKDSRDVGLFQISTAYHGTTAKKRGYDLYTIAGNASFAKYLLRTKGTSPWNASKPCWKQKSRKRKIAPSHS